MQALNNAVRENVPELRRLAGHQANVQVMARAISFADSATWMTPEAEPIETFRWRDLIADGVSDLGAAFSMVADFLRELPGPQFPPVLLLATDGKPTDDWEAGLGALMTEPLGRDAVRLAVGIGKEADYGVLRGFIGNAAIEPVAARNADELMRCIRWHSTVALRRASQGLSEHVSGSSSHSASTEQVEEWIS